MVKLRFCALLLGCVILAGCAARPGPELLTPTGAPANARLVKVLVATTRERAEPNANVFTSDRARTLNFAEFTIAIPPNHRSGTVELPIGAADPARSFVTVEQTVLTRAAFAERVASRRRGAAKQNVGVFVHGFNTNFQEALFRMAQIAADSRAEGTMVLFAWPSEARVTAYVADRDSVTFSRDHLADLLNTLAANPSVARVALIGHSMGSWLTVESLRQLRLAGKTQTLSKLNVVLAAPDIDVDVFRQQVAVIGPLKPPITLLVAKDDRALSFSSRLSATRTRVGALDINDPRVQEAALQERVRIVDISDLRATDRFQHDRYVHLAALYPQIAAEAESEGGFDLRRAGIFALDASTATVGNAVTAQARD